ncbi:MAG TPA: hypothetical protein VGO92_05560, partial [Acidimicrobiales bacterium]|nr:hypothetical protein [Acidimicrobiales bacterium]
FVAADARVQTAFAYFQDGFVRRTTARGGDGRWLVLAVWASAAAADGAEQAAQSDPATGALAALVDAGSVRAERFETLD